MKSRTFTLTATVADQDADLLEIVPALVAGRFSGTAMRVSVPGPGHWQLTRYYARWYAAWTWAWAKHVARETWDGIPGPKPVKIAVMALLGVCLLIPGPVDEIGVLLALRGIAWLGKRRAARRVLTAD